MRRRILLLVVGLTTIIVLAFAIPVSVLTRSVVMSRAQSAAMSRAADVARVVQSGYTKAQITAYIASLPQSDDERTSVVLPDGSVLGQSPPASAGDAGSVRPPGFNQTDPTPTSPAGGRMRGDQDVQLHAVPGGKIATAVSSTKAGISVVQVYVSDARLSAGVGAWLLLLGLGSLGLLVLGVLAGEVLSRRLIRPLTRTAQTANALSAGDVAARAPTTGPREVAEVGSALNRLADRINELIAEERETVANLSHRMRTPLTGLRLDAEALRDPIEAERIGAHVSAVERSLTAVIHAARRPQREGMVPSADATAVVAERVAFWSVLTEDQDRVADVRVPGQPLLVRTSEEDLGACVDALIENVIAHTPEGTAFAVALAPASLGAVLVVSDEGPGLPEGAGERGRSDRGSTGLGLDIARRTAEASGGGLAIGSGPRGGAVLTLTFGPP